MARALQHPQGNAAQIDAVTLLQGEDMGRRARIPGVGDHAALLEKLLIKVPADPFFRPFRHRVVGIRLVIAAHIHGVKLVVAGIVIQVAVAVDHHQGLFPTKLVDNLLQRNHAKAGVQQKCFVFPVDHIHDRFPNFTDGPKILPQGNHTVKIHTLSPSFHQMFSS